MPEKLYLISESQLEVILAQAKTTNVFAEETILEDQTVLDVYMADVPKYSLVEGTPL